MDVIIISLSQYMDQLGMHPKLLKQSMDWRLDHILDHNITTDTKEQWIYEIKEIIGEIVKRK